MKIHIKSIFTSGSLLFFILFVYSTSISAQEVDDEREFDYAEASEKGPRRWGELRREWEACNNGKMQSPIDMSNLRVEIMPEFGKLRRSYKPCYAIAKNRGHDVMLQWVDDAGSIQMNGSTYFLRQAHWHSPSEHTINGRRYAMELHMVHLTHELNVQNRIAVISVLYKIGRPEKFITKLSRNITSIKNTRNQEISSGMIDATEIKISKKMYYRYRGSLTVPPCTEGVIWTISKQVRTVSRYQVKLLRDAVKDYSKTNARPVQPHNSREIHLYGQGDCDRRGC